jgi:hypothetical protein
VTAAAERSDKYEASYVPPPPPAPGKIVVRAPADKRGNAAHMDLHLTPDEAEQLMDALNDGIQQYLLAIDHKNG